jgi:hypothetical protein
MPLATRVSNRRSNGVSAGNGHSGGICPDIDGLHDFPPCLMTDTSKSTS